MKGPSSGDKCTFTFTRLNLFRHDKLHQAEFSIMALTPPLYFSMGELKKNGFKERSSNYKSVVT